MKKRYFIVPTALLLLSGFYLSSSDLPKGFSKNQLMNISKKFVTDLNNQNYAVCYDRFNSTMKQSMPLEKLTEICNPILDSLGAFVRFKGFTFSPIKSNDTSYVVCMINCEYTKGSTSFLISIAKNLEVGGLYIK